ncbi:two-component regulator propeller domain-containing protein [Marinifilum fragile]|uniref:two-component regulator propeller domain-containing protein n=1 Tax=Marinifilum fragile TaxID=570161 RepID=UPI002AA619C1|nr:two-component regulator propeller domain-containing protein [Marinifilum fragile]
MQRRTIVITVLLLALSLTLKGMDLRHLTIHKGLSNNIVYSIVKDSKGLLWFGTRNGVDRYDGYQFKHYSLTTEDQLNSETNVAKAMLIDQHGTLWVGTLNGLFSYDSEKDLYNRLTGKNEKEISTLRINVIKQDEKGNILIGADNTAYIFNPKEDSLIKIKEINTPVLSILPFDNNHFIIGTSNGIYKINTTSYRISPLNELKLPNVQLSNSYCNYIFQDPHGRIWLCTIDQGVFIWTPKTGKIVKCESLSNTIAKGVWVKKILAIENGNYLVGVDGKGVYILNDKLEIKESLNHNEDAPHSLSNNGVYDLMKDDANRFWVATYGGGVNVYDPNFLPFEPIQHVVNKPNSLGNNTGRAVLEDSNGKIWFGTKKGVSILDPATNKWKHIYNNSKQKNLLGSNTILTLEQVNKNEVWIGSYGGGIDKINPTTGKTQAVFQNNELEKNQGTIYVYKLLKDRNDNIWIGSIRGQLLKYTPSTKKITSYPIYSVQNIYEGRNNYLYLGCREGFFLFNKNNGEYKMFLPNKDNPDAISSNACFCFYEDENGKVYIGTEGGGLNIFDPKTEKFMHFTESDGLPSNTIYGILPDDKGRLWLSTTNGLSLFNPHSKKFVNYDISDGLPIKEFNYGASCITSKGKMIFGGESGFVSFDPLHIQKILIAPKLFFTDFKISNKSYPVGDPNTPLQKHIDLTQEIELDYHQNSFSLDFVGINYTNPVKNRYSWKLENFENEWTPASSSSTATYTNIPPGTYTFKVRASNLQDDWNGKERQITLKVNPPYWQTYWAYGLYLILFFGAANFVLKFMKIRLQEKHSNEKIQFFINVAHDLKTPLTLIKSPLTSLSSRENLSEQDSELICMALKNVDKLTTHFTQLLDFQKAEMKKMQLQVAKHNLVEHLSEVSASFKPLLEKKRLQFQLLSYREDIALWYDKLKFDKIFYNLISNAIKYTPEEGKISICIDVSRTQCTIKVEDSGIGIPEKQQENIFKRYYRATNAINSEETGSGVGLLLVRQLVNAHSGSIGFTSKTNEGTCFTLKFKLDNKHFKPADFIEEQPKEKYIPVFKTSVKELEVSPEEQGQETELPDENLPKLLLVEDSKELSSFLSNELRSSYHILQAGNGQEALDLIKDTEPDIIVSDIMMPVMDGRVFCTHLKKNIETCHIPIILVTALTSSDYKIEGYELGADGYIEKPFDLRILKSKISNLLNSHKVLKEKFLKQEDTSEQINYKNELDQEFIQKCMDIVNENLDNSSFSVEEFSKKLFMSRPVLYRKLKALTDQSPQDFVKIIRLKKSAELIRTGKYSISEIAYSTGFSDPKYFSTSFKKFYGISPSKYVN